MVSLIIYLQAALCYIVLYNIRLLGSHQEENKLINMKDLLFIYMIFTCIMSFTRNVRISPATFNSYLKLKKKLWTKDF